MSDSEDKVIIAKQKKEIGDVAFKNGQVKDGALSSDVRYVLIG
jgi:hypothetical protein